MRQINVLIGRPNTGKTNILDAVKLFALPQLTDRFDVDLKEALRAQTPQELFLIKDSVIQYASVSSNRAECLLQYSELEGLRAQLAFDTAPGEFIYLFDAFFKATPHKATGVNTVVRPYHYVEHGTYSRTGEDELAVPYGNNLSTLLKERPELQKPISKIFQGTGATVYFDKHDPKISLSNGDTSPATELHFASLSASIQRLCFYLSAIQSNREKLLVFDDLDVHIFPVVLAPLVAQMFDNPSNQYLFSTHAYYILIDLLEYDAENVAIFNVYNEENETKIYRLTDEDLRAILYNGFDPFINNEAFMPKKSSAI